jgi:ketosteroid isomerase-like protein
MKTPLKILLALLLLSALASVSRAQVVNIEQPKVSIPSNEAQLKTLAIDFAKSLVTNDIETARSLMHPDFVIYGADTDSLNRDGYLDLWKRYHAEASSLGIPQGSVMALQIEEGPEAGDWAAFYGMSQWTPTGMQHPVSSWMHMLIRVEDGKVLRIYNFEDQLSILTQMGYQVVPPDMSTAKN